ncbi:MAG TPA: hypothetical protein DDW32_00610 [Thermotoga sp.]|nr:hypothetical protein [Thermotoga sp.]
MMFGYIKPLKCELKVKEYEEFRRYYCGVCKALKKYSIIPRFLLTYEAASLGLLLSSLNNSDLKRKRELCIFTLKKVDFYSSSEIDEVARIFVALLREKLKDNYIDRKNPVYLFASAFLKKDPEISRLFENFYEMERKEQDFEILAEKQGKIVGTILSKMVKEETQRKILYYLGLSLGKWLYIIDALDDFEKDKRKNVFNPLVKKYNGDLEKARSELRPQLKKCIDEMWKAYDLLDIKRNKTILDNIVYLGIPFITENVLIGKTCNLNHSTIL